MIGIACPVNLNTGGDNASLIYNWSVGGVSIPNSNSPTLTVQPSVTSTYTLTVTSTDPHAHPAAVDPYYAQHYSSTSTVTVTVIPKPLTPILQGPAHLAPVIIMLRLLDPLFHSDS